VARRSVTAARPRLVDRVVARVPTRAADAVPIATRAQDQFEMAVYDDALRLARQAARMAPDDANYQVLVGDASFKLGLHADAAAAYARAGILRPGDPSIRARLDRLLSTVRPAVPAEARRPRPPSIETTDPYAADLE
jgi:tetratricopeptide (TPR) repeat protein